MGRFGGGLLIIRKVNETEEDRSDALKAVARTDFLPLLALRKLLFQFVLRAQSFLVTGLNQRDFIMQVNNQALKLDRDFVDFEFIARCSELFRGGGDFSDKFQGGREFDGHEHAG